MLVSAVGFVAFRHDLPRLFTPDPGIGAICAAILPIAATFQIFDGLQVVGSGVLRGMGRTRPAAFFNLIGYYALGLPLAWWLVFELQIGIAGIWWGLCVGLAIVAAMLLLWVGFRGPGQMRPGQIVPGPRRDDRIDRDDQPSPEPISSTCTP